MRRYIGRIEKDCSPQSQEETPRHENELDSLAREEKVFAVMFALMGTSPHTQKSQVMVTDMSITVNAAR